MKKNLLFIFGTRPEAIKMLPIVIKARELFADSLEVRVCVTGQHRHMLDSVLDLYNLSPDYDLNIMSAGQDLYDVTSRILLGLRDLFKSYKPDCVLVHGDTSTTLASSLAAYYQLIPVAHVEAGLRTGNIYSPFPEEINRKLTGHIAKYHFTPTEQSKQNLLKENIYEHLAVVGNSVIDSLLWMVNKISSSQTMRDDLEQHFNRLNIDLTKKIILVTGHRRENFGGGFINICQALHDIAKLYPDVQIVYPVHLNPNVQKPVYELLSDLDNIYLIEPLDYKLFVFLMMKSYIILTDSGGVQEEAPSLGKPVLVMRNTTERPEAVLAGAVKLVGIDQDNIVREACLLLDDAKIYQQMSDVENPYGDGNASTLIIKYLLDSL